MKKFLLTFLTLLWISSIGFAAPDHLDPQGFNGYSWGTDFQTIHNDVNLELKNREGGTAFYFALKESSSGINPELFYSPGYIFYQNRLVGGFLRFGNSEIKKLRL